MTEINKSTGVFHQVSVQKIKNIGECGNLTDGQSGHEL